MPKIVLAFLAVPLLAFLLSMALVFVGFFGYLPSPDAVAREFERQHPGWRVAEVTDGLGDEDGCIYSIRYRKPPDSELHEASWYIYCSGIQFGWNYSESFR